MKKMDDKKKVEKMVKGEEKPDALVMDDNLDVAVLLQEDGAEEEGEDLKVLGEALMEHCGEDAKCYEDFEKKAKKMEEECGDNEKCWKKKLEGEMKKKKGGKGQKDLIKDDGEDLEAVA